MPRRQSKPNLTSPAQLYWRAAEFFCDLGFAMQSKMTGLRLARLALLPACLGLPASQVARAGGPLGIDHEWSLDTSGVWAQKYQNALEYGVVAVELGGGIWFGKDAPLGRTFWQSVDSTAISSLSAEILKLAFSRARPNQGNNADKWFQGSCCDSFP